MYFLISYVMHKYVIYFNKFLANSFLPFLICTHIDLELSREEYK